MHDIDLTMLLYSIITVIMLDQLSKAACLIQCKNVSVIYVVQRLGGVYCVNDISAKEETAKESSWFQRENEHSDR